MSISINLTKQQDNSLHLVRLTFTEESINELKAVLNRALNCWPDAPPDFKELSDILEYGKPLQDYQAQK